MSVLTKGEKLRVDTTRRTRRERFIFCVRTLLYADTKALATYEFDGHLLVVQQIGSLKDDSKGTLSNFLADPVVDADDV